MSRKLRGRIQAISWVSRGFVGNPKCVPRFPFAGDQPLAGKAHLTELRGLEYGFPALFGINGRIWQYVERSCNVFAADWCWLQLLATAKHHVADKFFARRELAPSAS